MHFFFSVGALIAPLCVRFAMASSLSGRDYILAFWYVGSTLLLPVGLLMFLKTPEPRKDAEKQSKGEILIPILATLGMVFFVGGEVGFGSYVLVYSKY